jgi:hypothetical protein
MPVPGKASIHAGLQPLAQVAQAFFKVSHEKYQVFFFAEKSFQIAIYWECGVLPVPPVPLAWFPSIHAGLAGTGSDFQACATCAS